MRSIVAIVLIIVAAALTGAGPALAHSELVSSDPAPDGIIAVAPQRVELVFNQNIEQQFANLTVTAEDGTSWAPTKPTVEGAKARADIRPAIPAGRYTVAYRVVSADGHPIAGTYSFTLTQAPDLPPPDSAAPQAQPAAPSATARPESAPAGDGSAVRWILACALGGLLIAGMVLALRSPRKTQRQPRE
ncbi:copper resistance CopC family protein [Nocardia ninae]|uniref:copper resistance CopC family protein n=1 Tax=Nocardia ninae TaxID=356145 RepID=UPI0016498E95|nr:copper resistance CopC family protein [Nocardia ninae]